MASMLRTHRSAVASALACVAAVLALAGCGASLGGAGAPTTTAAPQSTEEMCKQGQNAFQDIDEMERKKPDYLDKVKKALTPLDDRPPAAIREDMRAFVEYVQSVTDPAQLADLPADLKVSTGRIDDWWKQNCGKPFINA